MTTPAPETNRQGRGGKASRAALVAWAFYDWANNGFATVILTFIFAAYFTRRVAPDEVAAGTLWGVMTGVAGLLVALGGPVCGAAADQYGRRKPWLAAFTLLSVLATVSLWFVKPSADYVLPALLLVGVGMVGAEYSMIFYNSMLPELVPGDRVGRWSGWGWGLGYAGGLVCLSAALLVIGGGAGPAAGGAGGGLERIRASFVLAGCWYLVFALPLVFLVPDAGGGRKTALEAVRDGLGQLADTARRARQFRHTVRFLVARLFYIDGLATIFAMGGVYAAGVFRMSEREVLLFGIVLNVSAGAGAALFSGLDDRIGPKTVILISLAGLIAGGTLILLVHATTVFWLAGAFMGLFVGPVQSASRSFMARAAPERLRSQMFGLYAFSGKATAFAGPLAVGGLTHLSGSQRVGMSAVVLLLLVGGVLLLRVREPS